MLAIFRREMSTYFSSPLGYVFLAVFYFFSGMFFYYVLYQGTTDLSYVFSSLFSILIFIIPLLTMRLMSEEKKQKTDQLLLTSPASLSGIVYGKFFAALCMYAIALSVTVVYSVIVASYATPEWLVVIGSILGAFLIGAALISVGLFISALTESQMVAAIVSFGVMMAIFMIDDIATIISNTTISQFVASLSFMSRYKDLTAGMMSLSTVFFFASVIFMFNFLTIRMLERKRWG